MKLRSIRVLPKGMKAVKSYILQLQTQKNCGKIRAVMHYRNPLHN